MIRRTAYREGKFGNLMAEGVYSASKQIGRDSEKYAMQMKKMEIDDELRTSRGWTLGILTDPRGPTHTLGAFRAELKGYSKEQAKEIFGNENLADPLRYDGKPEIVVEMERIRIIQDCLGLCCFATHRSVPAITKEYNMKTYAEIVKAATGWSVSVNKLIQIAERILTLDKAINVLAGLGREDDYPPERFYDPIPKGPHAGLHLHKEKVVEMVSKYYELHGWDKESGIPMRITLEKLGLKEIADKLLI
jgi:aldehyde:ferredoxin oxidoreductase